MNKKLSLQICIISVTIIFSIFFFNKIFFKKNFEIVENKEVSISDEKNLIEGIQYFSKDIKGLYFCGGSGITDRHHVSLRVWSVVMPEIN